MWEVRAEVAGEEDLETVQGRGGAAARRALHGFAKLVTYLDDQCEVDKTFYNFCRRHRGLKGETPAMRQGNASRLVNS